jgi:signal peptidase I
MQNFLRKQKGNVLIALFFVSQASIASVNVVPSGSMLPTLQLGEALVVNKHAYGWRIPLSPFYLAQPDNPKRGDIVTFIPKQSLTETWVKRVVAVEGDKVDVTNGSLFVNGRELSHVEGLQLPPTSMTVPAGQVFLAGDNSANSLDSRYWGTLPVNRITGRVELKYNVLGRHDPAS